MNDLPKKFQCYEAFHRELARLNAEAIVRNGVIVGAFMPPGWIHRYDLFVCAGRRAGYVR